MTFLDILEHYGIPTAPEGHHHVTPGWIGLDCPNCSRGSGKFRLGYNVAKSYLSCWVCGHQSLPWTLCALTGEPYPVVKEMLGDLDREERLERRAIRGGLAIPPGVGVLLPAHETYLRKRGFDPDQISKVWGVSGIGMAKRLAWRLYIPIHLDGAVVSWTTRSLSDDAKAKYQNAKAEEESFPAKSLLYGEDHCRHGIIVCEGPTDVWRIGPGAVATFGVQFTQAQVLRISKYPIRAICFDNDPPGRKAARKLVRDLACFPGETHDVILDADDPGSAGVGEIGELRRKFLD